MAYDDEKDDKKKPRTPISRDPNTSNFIKRGIQSIVGGNPAVANIVANAQNRAPLLGAGSLAATAAPAAPPAAPPTTMPNPQPPRSPFDTMPASGLGGSPVSTPLAVPNGVVPYTPTTPTPPPMARQPTGLNPAMAGLGQINPIANAVNTAPMANAKASLEASPQMQAVNPLIRMQQAGNQIARNTGSGAINQQVADMSARTQLVAQNPNISIEQAQRNQQTQLANQQMQNSPLARQVQGDQAAVQQMRDKAMPAADAQKILVAGGKGEKRSVDATNRGELHKIKNDQADKLRRSEPLAQMNIARAQERPAQLLEKRERREQMGAANRLQRMAMGQRDPGVKALMTNQAAGMAKAVGQRQPAPRSTYQDFVDKDNALKLEQQKIATNAGGNYATPRGQRDLAEADKARAEIQAIRDRMPEQDKLKLASLDKQIEKMLPTDPGYAEVVRQRDAMFDSARKTGSGQGAARIDLTNEADAAKYPKGTEVYINGRRAIVE